MSKRIIFIVNIHSFVDVITNSSSELFVLDDGKSVDCVKELLQFMLDKWNELALRGVFGDRYVKNKRFSIGSDSKSKPIKTFDDTFGDIYIYTKKMHEKDFKETVTDGHDWGWGYEKEKNIGKIFIQSSSENSIPYEMFEWIETAFGEYSNRFHLG